MKKIKNIITRRRVLYKNAIKNHFAFFNHNCHNWLHILFLLQFEVGMCKEHLFLIPQDYYFDLGINIYEFANW